MIKKLLNYQTNNISFASLILAASYFVSAALGLTRDHLLAGKLGAGNELDVYYAAFTVPDFIALILVFGAISAAIIPIFSAYYIASKEEAWDYLNNLVNIFLVCLIVISGILMLCTPLLVSWIAPGFSPEKRELVATLMRFMFLSPIILGISNIVSGILQVFHRFLVTALAPIMYNIGIIIGILFFLPYFGLQGLVYGVLLGGVLHLLIQVPSLMYSGFQYKKLFNVKHTGVVKTLKLMIPRSLGLGAGQFNTIVVTAIASTLATGSIAVFTLASNLSSFLVNMVAVSISTAVFPAMAFAYSKKDNRDFENKFSQAFLQAIFLMVPASILLFVLRSQIVRVIYGSGKFNWEDTRLTAACLGIFAVSLFAQGLVFILSKTFYAAHNTKIPAVISILTVLFNIATSLFFVRLLTTSQPVYDFVAVLLRLDGLPNISVVGLAFAFSLTALTEAFVLLVLLYTKFHPFSIRAITPSLMKIAVAAGGMFVATFFARQLLLFFNIITLQTFLGVFIQLAVASLVGGICYLGICYLLRSQELKNITSLFFKKKY